MVSMIQSLVSVLGRLAFSAIFVLSAVGNKIPNFGTVSKLLGDKGLPAPKLMLAGAVAFLIVGGLSVISGFKTRWGALLLLLFLLPTTYLFHDFWNYDGEPAHMQQIQFMKNLSMAGALLFLIANGGGAGSLDGRRSSTDAPVVEETA